MEKVIKESRIPIIDFVRTLSILSVLSIHLAFAHFFSFPEPNLGDVFWVYTARNGGYGVSLFFLISGFLISRILIGNLTDFRQIRFGEFYIRRAARVLPLLLFVLVIGLGITMLSSNSPALTYGYKSASTSPLMWVSILTFTFNWFREWHLFSREIFGLHWDVLWSLSIEEQFYVFYPLLLWVVRTPQNAIRILLAIVFLGPVARTVAFLFPSDRLLLALSHSWSCFDLIAMGCLLFFVDRSLERRTLPRSRQVLLMSLGAILMALVYFGTRSNSRLQMIFAPSLLDTGLFLFLLGGLRYPFTSTPWTRAICWPGKLSYGMYLFHATALYLFWAAYLRFSPWVAFLFYVAATVSIAALSYHYFETPANRWIRSLYNR